MAFFWFIFFACMIYGFWLEANEKSGGSCGGSSWSGFSSSSSDGDSWCRNSKKSLKEMYYVKGVSYRDGTLYANHGDAQKARNVLAKQYPNEGLYVEKTFVED